MKNFPSKRGSRDSLAREHTCQSRVIWRIHHNGFAVALWTFSDHASGMPESARKFAAKRTREARGIEVRKRPAPSERSPRTSNPIERPTLSCLKRSAQVGTSFPEEST